MSLLKNLTAFAYVARVLRPQPVAWRPLVVRLCSQPVATLPPAIVSMAAWPRILGRSYSGQSGQKVDITPANYHKFSDETMNEIVDCLERLGEETDVPGFDLEYTVRSFILVQHGAQLREKSSTDR
ncbi:hypothetical protein BC936DRAFT_147616 [Jimgerdemannia flammicorona]|uniref:Uncharacterized protein n=1 Tax=Jimgerdemannia flammicorona TaxID=994334 RepID=A0A433D4Z0_9FUNG|nr:hypothetical protein BC936DRAFT_147616 [Jimgerdemannia flammicorona]